LYDKSFIWLFTGIHLIIILFLNHLRNNFINSKYIPYDKTRAFAVKLNLRSSTEWFDYCKGSLKDKPPKPVNIPIAVASIYKGCGWISWYHFLGNQKSVFNKIPCEQARDIVRSLGIKTVVEYNEKHDEYELRDKGVPKSPMFAYMDSGWINWHDYLGKVKKLKI